MLFQEHQRKYKNCSKIFSSPRTKNVLTKNWLVNTPEEAKETTALQFLAADISEGIQHLKKSKSNNRTAAYTPFKTFEFGNRASEIRAKKSLSRIVRIGRWSVDKAVKDRRRSWLYFERKTRSDALSDEDRQLVFTYWAYEQINRR